VGEERLDIAEEQRRGEDPEQDDTAGPAFLAAGFAIDEGEPLLSVVTTTDAGPNWVLYVRYPDRREVVRQIVVPAGDGKVTVRDSRLVATGIERVTVTPTGDGVTVEVEARRGRDTAFARGSASPRNP